MAVLEHDDVAARPVRIAASRLRTQRLPRRALLRWVMIAVAVAVMLGNAWLAQQRHDVEPVPGSALEALETLSIREALSDDSAVSGYAREAFGPAWADVDGNGCDTRNDVLARDLREVVLADGGCVVATGVLDDPYTGEAIDFVRGAKTSGAVQVDHVVALEDAWRTGAADWDAATRAQFANDPMNLLASDGPANMAKGSRDAAQWLPPAAGYRCEYVARQVAVKAAYELAVTAAEYSAIADVLAACPAEPLPLR
ncbi:HNH endonuclease family protein [Xylanimonas sp. McL0601]|uniref:HNH endonuclease family protein n=1 Tax=Xylanimonas sp. McL0601 TaxID=3414739 RepID=UPI003CEBA581